MNKKRGFTLVELLIYVGVFAIIAITFSSVLVTFTRVNISQLARNEIASQLNFVMQTLQRVVNESSAVVIRSEADGIDTGVNWDEEDSQLGVPQKYLVVRAAEENNDPNDANSPVVIYNDNGVIKVRQGRGSLKTTTDLTSDKVVVDNLAFTKFTNYPGRDIIEIDLKLSFNSTNPQQQASKKLILGVGKAVAAVFDTSLLPGAGSSLNVGGPGASQWQDAYFAGNVSVGGISIGGGSTPINGLFSGTISVDPPSIAFDSNGLPLTVTLPITFSAGDRVFLTPPQNLDAGLVYVGARTIDATDQIEITLRNTSADTPINGSAKNWSYLILR